MAEFKSVSMNSREYLLTLFDIDAGSLPIRIASDEFVCRKFISELILKGYVSTTMQAPDNSVFMNLMLTDSGSKKLAELRLRNPEISKTLPIRKYKAIILNVIYSVISLFIIEFFFRLLRGGF
jgi:hypothetical protein